MLENEDYSEDIVETKKSPVDILTNYALSLNIAESLEEDELNEIAEKVRTETDIDKASMGDWFSKNVEALKLAMQICEVKTFP